MDIPFIIGHRGAAGSAPENTMASFRRAAALGCAMVELDVRLSQDGKPVVFHDDRLDRTTNGSGEVDATPFADLRRLDAGSWFNAAFAQEPIPSLAEALAGIAELGMGVNIEIKAAPGREAETARLALIEARALWPGGRKPPMVSSFSRTALAIACKVVPAWPRGLLDRALPRDWPEACRDLACASVNLDHRHVDADVVRSLGQAGLACLAYTVNDAERARLLRNWGVRGIFTDRPEKMPG